MKLSLYLGLILFFTIFLINKTSGQTCHCDSLLEYSRSNWTRWVANSDSIEIVQVKKIGLIKTEKNKQKLLRLFNSDTSWVSYPTSGKKVIVRFGRLDTLSGNFIKTLDSFGGEARAYVGTKEDRANSFNANIKIGDEYYEVFFRIGNKIIMSPSFCSKESCMIIDNIISTLFITE